MDILTETQNLWQRFQRGGAFRIYLRDRVPFVIAALAIFVAYSVATTAGTVISLGGTRSILVLFGLLAAPFVLIGTLYVQVIVFFLWLENRTIARATRHVPPTPKAELAATASGLLSVARGFPLLVQAIGAAILIAPLAFLWSLSPMVAVLMLALMVATPFAYSLADR